MRLVRVFVSTTFLAATSLPACALNPQPFPPPANMPGTFADGERFKIDHGVLFLIDANGIASKARAGSYKLKNGQNVKVLPGGKFSSETIRRFNIHADSVDLNPQPFPPPKGGLQH